MLATAGLRGGCDACSRMQEKKIMTLADFLMLAATALAAAAAWGSMLAADRSNEISDAQTELLAEQKALAHRQAVAAEQQVRAALWSERIKVEQAARALMFAIDTTPLGGHAGQAGQPGYFAISHQFSRGVYAARHLFPIEGSEVLVELEQLAVRGGGAFTSFLIGTQLNQQAVKDDAEKKLEQVREALKDLEPRVLAYFDGHMQLVPIPGSESKN